MSTGRRVRIIIVITTAATRNRSANIIFKIYVRLSNNRLYDKNGHGKQSASYKHPGKDDDPGNRLLREADPAPPTRKLNRKSSVLDPKTAQSGTRLHLKGKNDIYLLWKRFLPRTSRVFYSSFYHECERVSNDLYVKNQLWTIRPILAIIYAW